MTQLGHKSEPTFLFSYLPPCLVILACIHKFLVFSIIIIHYFFQNFEKKNFIGCISHFTISKKKKKKWVIKRKRENWLHQYCFVANVSSHCASHIITPTLSIIHVNHPYFTLSRSFMTFFYLSHSFLSFTLSQSFSPIIYE